MNHAENFKLGQIVRSSPNCSAERDPGLTAQLLRNTFPSLLNQARPSSVFNGLRQSNKVRHGLI